jgi:hypothetical protein
LAECIQKECNEFVNRHVLEDNDTSKPNISEFLEKYNAYLNTIIEDLKDRDPTIFAKSFEKNKESPNKK